MVKINLPDIKYKYYEQALIYVVRGKGNRVVDRSMQKFTSRAEYSKFKKLTDRIYPTLEVHSFHLRRAFEPQGTPERAAHLWCPYCCSWRKFETRDGYTVCEICQFSTKDFYFLKYNPKYREKETKKVRKPKPPTTTNTENDDKKEKARLRRERRKERKLKEGKK